MKKKAYTYSFFFVLFVIVLLHVMFINGLENILFYTYHNSPLFRKPSLCEHTPPPVKCLGMPSGYTEIATLVGGTLYSANYISFTVWILLIAGTCFQRVVARRHTILQTMVGVLFGLFYTYIYLSIKNPFHKVGLCLCILFLYANMLVLKLDSLVSEKIPDWVDKQMLPSIEKKRNVPYYLKLMYAILPAFKQNITVYLSWKELEMYLDKIVYQIQKSEIKFDAVVGIKTGGAIISDYISKRLRLPNYKIKISRTKYQCQKTPNDIFQNYIDVNLTKQDMKYMVCEGVHDDLTGKNIILLDESIGSGNTMNASIDYFIQKKVNIVYPVAVVSKHSSVSHTKFPFTSVYVSGEIFPWPWGYDN